jgi:phage FluMu gp28-like protein
MPAILPNLNLDKDPLLSKKFLPYQVVWIKDNAPVRLAEKSVRIGWTYADAYKNVRKRLEYARRDYLFTTKDQQTAEEYIQLCYQFALRCNLTRFAMTHGLETWKCPRFDAAGRDTGFTEEIKVGVIKFDNRSRIIAFSSNPNALRAFGGDVGMDEFAFHPAAEQLWAAAAGRVTWGYDLGLWSSSNGDDTLFHSFAREAAAGQGGWSYYRVTLLDAVEMGLVERINEMRSTHLSRAAFIADCRNRARLPEVFEQEYLCQPRGSCAAMVPWAAIVRCQRDYPLERWHLEETPITDLFGDYQAAQQTAREANINRQLEQAFPNTFSRPAAYRLGFDVAASGQGDLSVIYVDAEENKVLQLRALFTCRTQDWHFLKTVLFAFMRHLPTVLGCGDETGLGRQICWEASKAFPGRFTPVNFRTAKQDLGLTLMNQLSVEAKRFPREPRDIAADYFALRKTFNGHRWLFSEGRNPCNPASHCDIAWAGALSSHAARNVARPGRIIPIPRGGLWRAHRRGRAGLA